MCKQIHAAAEGVKDNRQHIVAKIDKIRYNKIKDRGQNRWMFKVFTATDPIQSIVPYLQYTTRVLLMITFARGSR